MEQLTLCPACAGKNIGQKIMLRDHALTKQEFQVWQCADCRLDFTNPRPASAEIGPYYDFPDYVSHSDESGGWLNQAYRVARRYMIGRKVKLIEALPPAKAGQKSLLDYGCGSGYFLGEAARQGWQVRGVEPNDKARAQANTQVTSIRPGAANATVVADLQTLATSGERFGVITLWHVLEHVHQLDATIALLLELLAPGGRLVVAVPNAESEDAKHYGPYWAAYDVPRHLYHFSQRAMQILWQRHGAALLTTEAMPLDTYYVGLLSERFKGGNALGAVWHAWQANGRAGRSGQFSSLRYTLKRATDA